MTDAPERDLAQHLRARAGDADPTTEPGPRIMAEAARLRTRRRRSITAVVGVVLVLAVAGGVVFAQRSSTTSSDVVTVGEGVTGPAGARVDTPPSALCSNRRPNRSGSASVAGVRPTISGRATWPAFPGAARTCRCSASTSLTCQASPPRPGRTRRSRPLRSSSPPTCSRSSAARRSICSPCWTRLSSRLRSCARQTRESSFNRKMTASAWPQTGG